MNELAYDRENVIEDLMPSIERIGADKGGYWKVL